MNCVVKLLPRYSPRDKIFQGIKIQRRLCAEIDCQLSLQGRCRGQRHGGVRDHVQLRIKSSAPPGPGSEDVSMALNRPCTSKPRGICQYYNTPRGCFAGDKCKFLHGDPSSAPSDACVSPQVLLTPYDTAKTCRYYVNGAILSLFSFPCRRHCPCRLLSQRRQLLVPSCHGPQWQEKTRTHRRGRTVVFHMSR